MRVVTERWTLPSAELGSPAVSSFTAEGSRRFLAPSTESARISKAMRSGGNRWVLVRSFVLEIRQRLRFAPCEADTPVPKNDVVKFDVSNNAIGPKLGAVSPAFLVQCCLALCPLSFVLLLLLPRKMSSRLRLLCRSRLTPVGLPFARGILRCNATTPAPHCRALRCSEEFVLSTRRRIVSRRSTTRCSNSRSCDLFTPRATSSRAFLRLLFGQESSSSQSWTFPATRLPRFPLPWAHSQRYRSSAWRRTG